MFFCYNFLSHFWCGEEGIEGGKDSVICISEF